jgi:hypothetical protein
MGTSVSGNIIPDNNHVSRYCKPTQIVDNEIQASAFVLREIDEGLSVDWLEFLDCISHEEEINEVRSIYQSRFGKLRANAKIAVLNVGEIRTHVYEKTEDNRNLSILHLPFNNDTHSEIRNMRPNYEFIAELIAEKIQVSYPARNPQ